MDLQHHITLALDRICHVIPELNHIKMKQVRVSASKTRSRSRAGLLAYVSPRRFRGGSPIATRQRAGFVYHFGFKPVFEGDVEILYFIYFLVPRFFNLSYEDKIKTLIHELYHIHPDFNGDFRRFPGYQRVHGKSLKDYDRIIQGFYERFILANNHFREFEFLRYDARKLLKVYGELHFPVHFEGRPVLLKKEPVQKLVPVSANETPFENFLG